MKIDNDFDKTTAKMPLLNEIKLPESSRGNTDAENKIQTKKEMEQIGETEKIKLAPLYPKRSVGNLLSRPNISFRSWSKYKEEHASQDSALAFVMMGYVLVFLICHSPRLLLNIYELATIRYEL